MTIPRLVLVGGCHRDLVARPSGRFQPGTSCPGLVRETAGGVARNVAILVASAGIGVRLVSRVGDDDAGRAVVAGLVRAGVDAGGVAIDPAVATGAYVAVHDEAGELVAAISDLGAYDRLTPATLAPERGAMDAADFVFCDANPPEAAITALGEHAGPRLVVDAISRAKARRVLPALRAGALGFVNLPAAEALAGRPLAGPREAAHALDALGVRRAVLTGGSSPVTVLEGGILSKVPVPAVSVTDVTGAGDALVAGTLAALLSGAPLERAVETGVKAAAAAVASTGALDALPPSVLEDLALQAKPSGDMP